MFSVVKPSVLVLLFSLALFPRARAQITILRQPTLRYTRTLQQLNGGRTTEHLRPGRPIRSKLAIIDILLGPDRTELQPDDFVVRPAKLDAVFPELPEGRAAYRLIHFTDTQLIDRGERFVTRVRGIWPRIAARIGNRRAQRSLRYLKSHFFHDHADVIYAAFVLKAARWALVHGRVQLAVHTGDSLHVSTASELAAFNALLERALLAGDTGGAACWRSGWLTPGLRGSSGDLRAGRVFNVIGNHDALTWGNIPARWRGRCYGVDLRYQASQGDINSLPGLGDALKPTKLVDEKRRGWPAKCGKRPAVQSYFHVDRPLLGAGEGKVRLVFLNTNERNLPTTGCGMRGYSPAMSRRQGCWLRETLRSAGEDIDHVLVFGHNPLWSGRWTRRRRKRLAKIPIRGGARDLRGLLCQQRKVIGYFAGHIHAGVPPGTIPCGGKKKPSHSFVQMVPPALSTPPKAMAVVTVEQRKDGAYAFSAEHLSLLDLRRRGVTDAPFARPTRLRGRGDQGRLESWVKGMPADPRKRVGQLATDCYRSVVRRPWSRRRRFRRRVVVQR
jgi:hypothetical protein